MLSLMQKILMAALQSFLTPQTALMQILQRQKHETHWPYVLAYMSAQHLSGLNSLAISMLYISCCEVKCTDENTDPPRYDDLNE